MFLRLIRGYKKQVFPILVPVLVHLRKEYWYPNLKDIFGEICDLVSDIDPLYFQKNMNYRKDSQLAYLIVKTENIGSDRVEAEKEWEKLYQQAKKVDSGLERPAVPYSPDHLVGDFNGLGNTHGEVFYR